MNQTHIEFPPASRNRDPETAKIAGDSFYRKISSLHLRILEAFKTGPLTDETLERLPVFSSLAPSTVRKRRSELYYLGLLRHHDTVINRRGRPMMRWILNEPA